MTYSGRLKDEFLISLVQAGVFKGFSCDYNMQASLGIIVGLAMFN